MPPIDQLRDTLLHVVLPPAVLAAVLLALPALIGWRAKHRDVLTQIGAALGTASGLALGIWLNDEELLSQMPQAEGWRWLPLTALAALVIAAVAQLPALPGAAGWALRGATAANAGWLLTPAGLRDEHLWAAVALGGVILGEWAVLELLAGKGMVPLPAALQAIAASVVLIYAPSLRFNQLALILAGSVAGVGVAAVSLRAAASAASAGAAIILPALLLSGWYEREADVPPACFILIALAPLLLVPSLLPAWQHRHRTVLWLVQLLLLLLPLIAAIWLVTAELGPLEYE